MCDDIRYRGKKEVHMECEKVDQQLSTKITLRIFASPLETKLVYKTIGKMIFWTKNEFKKKK